MTHFPSRQACLALAICSGCVVGEPSDAPPAPAPDNEEVPLPTSTLSGRVLDDFTDAPLPAAMIETIGLAEERRALTDDGGAYKIAGVPQSSVLLLAAKRESYRDTFDDTVAIGEAALVHDVRVVSRGDAERQHATAGLAMPPESAIVIVDLGAAGIPRADVALVVDGTPRAPLFFGALGDVDPALASSQLVRGRARAAFLAVPQGAHELRVRSTTKLVIAKAGGATLTRVETAGAPPMSARFDDVRRILQRAADGGSGCASCHTAGGAAPIVFDDPADALHATLRARTDLVDVADPAASLLLTKPLYELPANHPNATWLDTNHADYQTIRAWIAAGAPR